MYNNKNHFSDENVYLVNTIDYPKYGLNIERVKAAYRSISMHCLIELDIFK